MKKCKILSLVLIVGLFPAMSWASDVYSLDTVDMPTANTMLKGMYNFTLKIYEGGGIATKGWVSFANSFMVGASFNLENVVGRGEVKGREPKLIARLRFINESAGLPAFSLGYEPQGYGVFDEAIGEYSSKPIGLYVVASKTISFFEGLQYSVGAGNRNVFKDFQASKNLDIFLGGSLSLTNELALLAEYDDIFKDTNIFNFGVRFAFSSNLTLELDFKNLTKGIQENTRTLRIHYTDSF
ncbi:MAG: hypothetical protein AABY84_06395 [Candidatus Firestonebacteria bacterium]